MSSQNISSSAQPATASSEPDVTILVSGPSVTMTLSPALSGVSGSDQALLALQKTIEREWIKHKESWESETGYCGSCHRDGNCIRDEVKFAEDFVNGNNDHGDWMDLHTETTRLALKNTRGETWLNVIQTSMKRARVQSKDEDDEASAAEPDHSKQAMLLAAVANRLRQDVQEEILHMTPDERAAFDRKYLPEFCGDGK
jgi:hypothetical protein